MRFLPPGVFPIPFAASAHLQSACHIAHGCKCGKVLIRCIACAKYHAVAFNAADGLRRKICSNNHCFADELLRAVPFFDAGKHNALFPAHLQRAFEQFFGFFNFFAGNDLCKAQIKFRKVVIAYLRQQRGFGGLFLGFYLRFCLRVRVLRFGLCLRLLLRCLLWLRKQCLKLFKLLFDIPF